ncbi:MAG: peptide-methionine (S)-S-oxide reductase MsrA [Halanaerobiaceae bacterium]
MFLKEVTCVTEDVSKFNKSLGDNSSNYKYAIMGGGCFWCVEEAFRQLKGVVDVKSGYSGGTTKHPTYKEVCSGETGHAEVVQIIYNPDIIGFENLLEVFFFLHDPTTLNRQGADIGTQYRSVIFYYSQEQKLKAEKFINMLESQNVYKDPIVTVLEEFKEFYPAEDYHQNYYPDNKEQSYCQMVISPKLSKFRARYRARIK